MIPSPPISIVIDPLEHRGQRCFFNYAPIADYPDVPSENARPFLDDASENRSSLPPRPPSSSSRPFRLGFARFEEMFTKKIIFHATITQTPIELIIKINRNNWNRMGLNLERKRVIQILRNKEKLFREPTEKFTNLYLENCR